MLQEYGHAGGHLRDALLNALDHGLSWWQNIEIDFNRERHDRWWQRLSPRNRAKWLLGQLWNCTDIVPQLTRSEVLDWFNVEEWQVFTYGRLARLLAGDLKADEPEEQHGLHVVV